MERRRMQGFPGPGRVVGRVQALGVTLVPGADRGRRVTARTLGSPDPGGQFSLRVGVVAFPDGVPRPAGIELSPVKGVPQVPRGPTESVSRKPHLSRTAIGPRVSWIPTLDRLASVLLHGLPWFLFTRMTTSLGQRVPARVRDTSPMAFILQRTPTFFVQRKPRLCRQFGAVLDLFGPARQALGLAGV